MHAISGDLLRLVLEGRFDVIAHGCNCQCQMGKGIALSIRKQFPEAYEADLKTSIGAEKLGTISSAKIVRGDREFVVVNAYTQVHWRGVGVKVDYEAIRACMRHIKQSFGGQRIAYPKIGAGLAGGDWSIIKTIIETELNGENHTLVELPN